MANRHSADTLVSPFRTCTITGEISSDTGAGLTPATVNKQKSLSPASFVETILQEPPLKSVCLPLLVTEYLGSSSRFRCAATKPLKASVDSRASTLNDPIAVPVTILLAGGHSDPRSSRSIM